MHAIKPVSSNKQNQRFYWYKRGNNGVYSAWGLPKYDPSQATAVYDTWCMNLGNDFVKKF